MGAATDPESTARLPHARLAAAAIAVLTVAGVLTFRFTAGRAPLPTRSGAGGEGATVVATNRVEVSARAHAPTETAMALAGQAALYYEQQNGDAELIARRLAPFLESAIRPAELRVEPWPPGPAPPAPTPDVSIHLRETGRTTAAEDDALHVFVGVRAMLYSGLVPFELRPPSRVTVDVVLDLDLHHRSTFQGWWRENQRRVAVANHVAGRLGREIAEHWRAWRDEFGVLRHPAEVFYPAYREPTEPEGLHRAGFSRLTSGPGWLTPYQALWRLADGEAPVPPHSLIPRLQDQGWSPADPSQSEAGAVPLHLTRGTRILRIWPAQPDALFQALSGDEALPASGDAVLWLAYEAERWDAGEITSAIDRAWRNPLLPLESLALVRPYWRREHIDQAAARLRRLPPATAGEAWLAAQVHREQADADAARRALHAAQLLSDLTPAPRRITEAVAAAAEQMPPPRPGDQPPTSELLQALGFIDLGALGRAGTTRTMEYRESLLVYGRDQDALRLGAVWMEPVLPRDGEPAAAQVVQRVLNSPHGHTTTRRRTPLPAPGKTRRLTRFAWAPDAAIHFEHQSQGAPFVVYFSGQASEP